MTRKHFRIIAEAIKEVKSLSLSQGISDNGCLGCLIDTLADKLKQDNNLFNYEIFKKACGF
jgi:hypothetical protein